MKKRILIIEDSLDFRELLKQILKREDYEVLEAGKAKDGIALAVKERPDLILMDIRLPYKRRGVGAARILRANEETGDIPIIFVSAYLKEEQIDEIKNIANCGYVTKPVKVQELLEEIRRYVK